MFKGIDIKLSGPICDCDELSICWYITGESGLGLKCKICGTELLVPHKKFRANFILNTPYPGKKEQKEKLLEKVDNDKILNFKLETDPKKPKEYE